MSLWFSIFALIGFGALNVAVAEAPLKNIVTDAKAIPELRELGAKNLADLSKEESDRLRITFPKKVNVKNLIVETPVRCRMMLTGTPTPGVNYAISHRAPARAFTVGSVATVTCESGPTLTFHNIAMALKQYLVVQYVVSNSQMGHGAPGNSQMGSGPGAKAP